jgi:hypothetical protein
MTHEKKTNVYTPIHKFKTPLLLPKKNALPTQLEFPRG